MAGERFLFVMWEGGGNVSPQLGLARRMVQRGHEVRVLTEPSLEDDVAITGASFVSFTTAPHRHDRSRESDFVRDFEAMTPIGAFVALRDNLLLGPARRYAEDTLAEIARFRPHVLVPDWMVIGAAVAGEAAGVPTALLMHNLNIVPEPGKPAPGFGFMPAKSVVGRARDRVFVSTFFFVFNRGLRSLNDARRALELPPIGDVLDHLERPDRFLVQYSEAFDLPARTHMPSLRYVGPTLESPSWAEPWTSPWQAGRDVPLVLISLSTTYMAQEKTLRRCIDAVADMPVQALVTVGPALDPVAFPAPDNVRVVRSAPHDVVLSQASAVITHGGLGTVTRSLANGVPLVCMPMGRDQGDVTARVRWHGAGLMVGRRARANKIRVALKRVLGDPSFRDAAMRLRTAIQADQAADRGVAELEGLAKAAVDRGNGAVAT